MNFITAYDLIQSANAHRGYLEINTIYCKLFNASVLDVYIKYCEFYFENTFIHNGVFTPVDKLNLYELQLFSYHPAFVSDNKNYYFKGYSLLKGGV